jgi:hypothetical protein
MNLKNEIPQTVFNCLNIINDILKKDEKRNYLVFSLTDPDINRLRNLLPDGCLTISDSSSGKVPNGFHYCQIDLNKIRNTQKRKPNKPTVSDLDLEQEEER